MRKGGSDFSPPPCRCLWDGGGWEVFGFCKRNVMLGLAIRQARCHAFILKACRFNCSGLSLPHASATHTVPLPPESTDDPGSLQ